MADYLCFHIQTHNYYQLFLMGGIQLMKMSKETDAKGYHVKVLETFINLGPIVDFCILNPERPGLGRIVTCSGAYKDGSIRVIDYGMDMKELVSSLLH